MALTSFIHSHPRSTRIQQLLAFGMAMDSYFESSPVADASAMIIGPQYRFTLINNMVLRYEWAADGVFEDRASTFAINRRFSERPTPRVKESESELEIITPQFHLSYDKKRFSSGSLVVTFNSKVTLWGSEWRYGNGPEHNLGGTARTLDDVDGRCDVGTGVLSRVGFSFIDDSHTMLFDGRGFVAPRRPGDRIDGYLFFYGHDFKGAMQSFFAVSGPPPRLPRWALGNWWSRYHRYTAKSYLELMDEFQRRCIPLSVAVIDMDWHLVSEPEVPHTGWTGYTWNRALFPDPSDFTKQLHDRGLKVSLNDHPHAGIHHHEEQYEEVAKYLGHDTTHKTPILFDPTSEEFMKAYFQIVHRSLEKQGCDFWWIDWQQGPVCRVPGIDPLWLLNHFQFCDTFEQSKNDAIVFSRYAGPGSHRYPVGFSGDSIITWDSLAFQPEFTATASNIGYGWWSHDIGGHMGGRRDDELQARWVQFGVFSPIMRLHSSNSHWTSKEPWLYHTDASAAMSNFMRLRHRLLPYLYSMSVDSAMMNKTLIQPVYWNHPERDEAYLYRNSYHFGTSLFVAPITNPCDPKTRLASTTTWIPASSRRYVDIFTGTVYDADREVRLYRGLSTIPVLAPEGSIVPLDASEGDLKGCYNPEALEILVVVGQDGNFDMFEDMRNDRLATGQETSGPDKIRQANIYWKQADGVLGVISEIPRTYTFRFLSLARYIINPTVTTGPNIDSSLPLGYSIVTERPNSRWCAGTVIQLRTVSSENFFIKFRMDPQLDMIDHSNTLKELLFQFQMPFEGKERIWKVLSSNKPNSIKVSSLLSMEVDEAVVSPLIELLQSDSRSL